MADTKISALTAATTPLAGTEVFPIVQTGTTVKASIANVQVAPVASGNANSIQYLNGSKVPSTDSTFVHVGKDVGIGIAAPTSNGGSSATVCHVNDPTAGNWAINHFTTGTTGSAGGDGVIFGLIGDTVYLLNYENTPVQIWTNAANRLQIEAAGDVTVKTGNLIQGTAAKGVNFTANTPAAGMTSQLLNWYEEGTWTATLTGSTSAPTTPVTTSGTYTRIGRTVTVQAYFNGVNTTGASGDLEVTGLPFTVGSVRGAATIIMAGFGSTPAAGVAIGTTVYVADMTTATSIPMSAGAGKYLYVTMTYQV